MRYKIKSPDLKTFLYLENYLEQRSVKIFVSSKKRLTLSISGDVSTEILGEISKTGSRILQDSQFDLD